MDVQTTSHQLLQAADGQRYSLQQLLEKLLSRNKFAPAEVEQFQTLVKNVRDAKNFQKIMDKFKIGQNLLDADLVGGGDGIGVDGLKDGECEVILDLLSDNCLRPKLSQPHGG